MSVTHEDLNQRMNDGEVRFQTVEKKLDTLIGAVGEVKKEVVKTREVVEAFETMNSLAKFVKWANTAVAGLLAIWVFLKAMAKGLIS